MEYYVAFLDGVLLVYHNDMGKTNISTDKPNDPYAQRFAKVNDRSSLASTINSEVHLSSGRGEGNLLGMMTDPKLLEAQPFYAAAAKATARVLEQDQVTPQDVYRAWIGRDSFF